MTVHREPRLIEPLWRRQPQEQVRLLNPAFLGALIYSAAKGYEEESDGSGLPMHWHLLLCRRSYKK